MKIFEVGKEIFARQMHAIWQDHINDLQYLRPAQGEDNKRCTLNSTKMRIPKHFFVCSLNFFCRMQWIKSKTLSCIILIDGCLLSCKTTTYFIVKGLQKKEKVSTAIFQVNHRSIQTLLKTLRLYKNVFLTVSQ